MPRRSTGPPERFATAELEDGLLVLTDEMPWVRSVGLGIWVRWGSAHEREPEMGVSHLLEHMVFKGTGRRSAKDLALELERLGGSLDAYTTREHTSFQARVLDEHVNAALDVLADMVLSPLLRAEDLELEREVVLEEIAAVEDTPDDLVFDLHARALWNGHPYGYTILGTRETVATLRDDDLRRIHAGAYHRANLIVAAAGNVRHGAVVERVRALLDGLPAGERTAALQAPTPRPAHSEIVARPSAQTHIVFGVPTFGHGDARRYALILLSAALGGGMSSRLFQRVREELGLAYTVYSYHTLYHRAGICGVYVGTRPEWAERAESVVRDELERVAGNGLPADELEDVKGQVKGQLVLSLESSGARLQRVASVGLYDEPFLTLDELIGRIDDVSVEDVANIAAEYCDPSRQVILKLGPEE
jgi:predicted Zn-dependent peptidase